MTRGRNDDHQKRSLITGITDWNSAYLTELLLGKGYEVHGIKQLASSFITERIDHLDQYRPSPKAALW